MLATLRAPLVALLFASLLSAAYATATDPAKLVSVGDHRLFLDCTGSAPGPTVVLIASLGSDTWEKIQPAVASFAHVCRYDRMGMGDSDLIVPPEQTINDIVVDLHTLLANAGLKPPFVLVGHSIAGLYARKYTTLYPAEVAGIVFVDSADEEQVWRYQKISHSLLFEYRDWPDFNKLGQKGWLPPESLLTWHDDVPLIVLEHGINWPRGTFKGMTEPEFQTLNATWDAMQRDLASRSKYGQLRIASKSKHFIQTYQPEVVVQAIQDVLDQITHLAAHPSASSSNAAGPPAPSPELSPAPSP